MLKNITLNKETAISLSLALTIFAAIIAFAVRSESRMTRMEEARVSDLIRIQKNEAKIEKLEDNTGLTREIKVEMQSIKEDLKAIKTRLNVN